MNSLTSRLSTFLAAFCLAITGLTGAAQADIHDNISDQEGPFRKLGRGLANVFYGITEIPMNMIRENQGGHLAGASTGITVGAKRTGVRLGYGLYEVFTFPFATNSGTYRSPFHNRATIYGNRGYEEFPPELGFFERHSYTKPFPGH